MPFLPHILSKIFPLDLIGRDHERECPSPKLDGLHLPRLIFFSYALNGVCPPNPPKNNKKKPKKPQTNQTKIIKKEKINNKVFMCMFTQLLVVFNENKYVVCILQR